MPEARVNGIRLYYDRRGCTRSERPEPYERTSVAEQGDDAAALLDALAATPAVVIGRSYGGAVAVDLALRHPDRLFATIDKPTLLVAASESPAEQREMTEAMASALPNARTALVAGGHLIDPAAPEVLAFIEELLETRSPRSGMDNVPGDHPAPTDKPGPGGPRRPR